VYGSIASLLQRLVVSGQAHLHGFSCVKVQNRDAYMYTPDPVISKVNWVSQLVLVGLSSSCQRRFSLTF